MKLKELENVIDDNASVSVQTKSNKGKGLPLIYDSWKECKESFKDDAWNEEVKLTSYGGIQIYFMNI